MKSADQWFQEGLGEIALSRSADYRSEYVGDLERAVAAFDQALALEPSHRGALHQRGLALAILGRHEAALDSFVAAAAVSPEDAELRLAVAQSLVKLEQWESALRAFDEVLRLRPEDQEALFGRASALARLERDELALAAWDEVLRGADNKTITSHGRTVRVLTEDFRRLRAQLSRALALGRLGRAEAEAAFREVFEANAVQLAGPSAPDVFHEALRTLEVARRAFHAFVEANLSDPMTLRRAASAWLMAKRPEDSVRAWDRAIASKPDAAAWWGKAEAHVQAGQLELAIAAYERSLQVTPGYGPSLARLPVVKARRG